MAAPDNIHLAPEQTRNTMDDPRVIQDLEEFCAALERGEAPNAQYLLVRYPDIADELAACLRGLEAINRFVPQVRAHTGGVGPVRTDDAGRADHCTLGDFRLRHEIGRGGMGVVYEAEQISLERRVALKVLPFASLGDPRQLQRFQNEARAAASLDHPNIVQVFSVGCEESVHYYAMQYIEGKTLARVIQELKELQAPAHNGHDKTATSEQTRMLLAGNRCPRDDVYFNPASTLAPAGGGEGAEVGHDDSSRESRIAADARQPIAGRGAVADEDPPDVEEGPGDVSSQPPEVDSEKKTGSARDAVGGIRTATFFHSVARMGIEAAGALEHAHQLGVVHRDVKPSNLILDVDGKLWISDFGLAQTQTGPNITMTGDILGTLRYMSPEQAEGNRRILDHHTDIYSLGVTLYELLTLRPPFDSDDRHQLIHKIIDGDPRPPRRLNPAIPRDLETIVLKALATEPEARYITAQEMADDLRRFLDDKPIQARRPTLMSRAMKCCRRHTSVVAAVAVASVITVISLAISTVLIAGAAYREAEQAHVASEQRDEAKAQRDRAEANKQLALQALEEIYVELAEERLPKEAHLSEADKSLLRKALRFYEAFAESNDTEPAARIEVAKAYRRVGDIQFGLGELEEAEFAYRRSVEAFLQLADELPIDPAMKHGAGASLNNLGMSSWKQGKSDEAEQAYRHALELSRGLCDQYPNELAYREELARSHNNLAVLLATTERWDEAEEALFEARELWEGLAQDLPNSTDYQHRYATCLANLANIWMEKEQVDKAEETLVQSEEIARKLLAHAPLRPSYQALLARVQNSMGVLVRDTRDDQEAQPFFEEAIACWRALARKFPGAPEYQEELRRTSQNLLGILDKSPDDEQVLARALALRKELVDTFPQFSAYRDELAQTHIRLAGLLTKRRQLTEAECCYRQAIALWEQPSPIANDTRRYRKGLAGAYNNLGSLCRATGQAAAAAEAYRKAVSVLDELATDYGAIPAFRESVASTWRNLGVSIGTSQPDEAREALARSRQAFDDLVRSHPDNPKYRVGLAASDTVLGNQLAFLGRAQDAELLFREALGLRWELAEQFPDDAAHQNSHAWLLANCADPKLRDPIRAVAQARKAVELDASRAPFWNTLGAALYRAGQWESAIEALEKSTELGEEGDGSDWFFLAMAHWQFGDKDEAREGYDRAAEWMDRQRPHDAELCLLREEVGALLGITLDSDEMEVAN